MRVTAGRTTYPESLLGTAVSTIDFMYFAPEGSEEDTLNFYANNVAFRRDVFAEFGYAPRDGVYRGHCQVLGMELRRAGVPIRFVPDARTFHELPASARDFLALRLHRGSDAALLSPDIVTTYAPSPLRHVALSRRLSTAAVMLGRVAMSASSFGQQQMPELKGWRSAAAMGAMLGTSALDGVGALLQLAGARPSRTDTISLNTERHDALRDAS